ncbi:FKBP-type peptidyl-prolyl cis-trans isomerase [Pseudoscourfieldia marina]
MPPAPLVDITLLVAGNGKYYPKDGETVAVHYIMRRQDGTIIDNSYERAKPFTFGVSLGDVLPGWNEVVKQMSVGDKAECVLPPNLMYSAKGLPGLIEPNMNIHLEVELVSIQTSADTDQGNDKRRRNR